MRTQDITTILKIRQLSSFSRAAEVLDLSQPAVSLAVKRVEEELDLRIFDRSGASVSLTPEGHRVLRGLERILEILQEMKGRGVAGKIRMGVSPLLSGRDVAKLLEKPVSTLSNYSFAIEFLDSNEIIARSDFDVAVVLAGPGRRSTHQMEFCTRWIGNDNGIFLYSKQEPEVWDRAMRVLVDNGVTVDRIIEVNDCGYAYHLASSGAGFTPCVMTKSNSFRDYAIPSLPELQPTRLEIFAESAVADMLKEALLDRNPLEGIMRRDSLALG